MRKENHKLVLSKKDYDLLTRYVFSRMDPSSGESRNAEQLYNELLEATVYEEEAKLPDDVIRLHSFVRVEEQPSHRQMSFRLVMPEESNLKQGRLSIFAPLAIALIGYRRGQQIEWQMPSGKKTFTIKDVNNGAKSR